MEDILKQQPKRKCRTCPVTEDLTLHHIIPKRTGLRTKKEVLCRRCHNIADMLANALYPFQLDVIRIEHRSGELHRRRSDGADKPIPHEA